MAARADRTDTNELQHGERAGEPLVHPQTPRARHASEWTDRELELLRTQSPPSEAAEFDDEGTFVGHD